MLFQKYWTIDYEILFYDKTPVNSIPFFSMNYYFVILLRQKPQSEWRRRMSIISLLCTVLSRHFPWPVRFSNVLCIFQVNKNNDYNE